MPGLLGKKIGMTSIYTADGQIVPVTVVETGPCKVLAVRTLDKDGYEALQLGFGEKKEKHVKKPQQGYYQKHNLKAVAAINEFKDFNVSEYKIGDDVTVSIFKEGDKVKITGKSKGKGFQGVVKRHGFGGVGGRSHGQHNRERAPGSLGQSSDPSRVYKGIKMAGRTGGKRATISGSTVVKVDAEKNLLFIKGGVPGAINSIVEIKK